MNLSASRVNGGSDSCKLEKRRKRVRCSASQHKRRKTGGRKVDELFSNDDWQNKWLKRK